MRITPLCRRILRRLQAARDQDDKQLTVVELPMPQPVVFETPTVASQLCQFLHCQQRGARPGIQSSERPYCSKHAGQISSLPAPSFPFIPGTSSGDLARCIA